RGRPELGRSRSIVRVRSDGSVEPVSPRNVDQFTVRLSLYEEPLGVAMDTKRHQLFVLAKGQDPTESTLTLKDGGTPMTIIAATPSESLFTYDAVSNELTFVRVIAHGAADERAATFSGRALAFDEVRDQVHVLDGDRILVLAPDGALQT